MFILFLGFIQTINWPSDCIFTFDCWWLLLNAQNSCLSISLLSKFSSLSLNSSLLFSLVLSSILVEIRVSPQGKLAVNHDSEEGDHPNMFTMIWSSSPNILISEFYYLPVFIFLFPSKQCFNWNSVSVENLGSVSRKAIWQSTRSLEKLWLFF